MFEEGIQLSFLPKTHDFLKVLSKRQVISDVSSKIIKKEFLLHDDKYEQKHETTSSRSSSQPARNFWERGDHLHKEISFGHQIVDQSISSKRQYMQEQIT